MSSDAPLLAQRQGRRRPVLAVVVTLASLAVLAILANALLRVSSITNGFVEARLGMMETANAQRDVLVFHDAVLRFAIGGKLSEAELRRALALQQLDVLAGATPDAESVKRVKTFHRELAALDLRPLRTARPGSPALTSIDERLTKIDKRMKVFHDEGTLRFQSVTDNALSARARTQQLLAALIVLTVLAAGAWALQARRRSRSDIELAYAAARRELEERKQAEVALRQSLELQSKVIETSTDLLSLVSLDGNVIFVSQAIETILGLRSEDVVGTAWEDLVHSEDAPATASALAMSRIGDHPEPVVARLHHRDGHWVQIEGVSAPIVGENGEVEMVLVICRDVTESRRSEETRAALESQLHQSQKIEAVGRLAGGIAHDFNNLLLAISGYSDLAVAKLAADSPARADVEEVRVAADRAAALTRQLLAYSRKQVLQERIVDLNEIVGGLGKMLTRLLGEDITLVMELSPTIVTVQADPGQLEQVLMNLAINARDAMPTGGRLEITTSSAELDEAYAASNVGAVPGEYVKLTVADTGEGMDVATLQKAFEPFFTTKPQGKGTGLGLATVYGIVTQTGGHIAADSKPGRGTAFEVYLPRATGDVDARKEKPAPGAPAQGETVLLVEDEGIVRQLVRRMLEEEGYRVLTAAGGDEALAVSAAHDAPIDVLVTDVVMPGASGSEVAHRLREERPSVGVVFVSGYTEEAVESHGVFGEHATFLQKPFSATELAAALRDVLNTKRAAQPQGNAGPDDPATERSVLVSSK